MEKRWFIPRINHELEKSLRHGASLSQILSQILINRSIETPDQVKAFFSPSLTDLLDPFLMTDIEKAAIRIKAAVKKKEKILIYGDYDVDGITGTALLFLILTDLGADVSYHIPDRLTGYGLNLEVIRRLKTEEPGISLIITVDCGTTSIEETDLANSLGIDIIITDHHLISPASRLPSAYAIINPNRPDSNYPFKDLAGVGVVFKLCQAIMAVHSSSFTVHRLEQWLDLVALGTIADLVPLIEENRILVKAGLEVLSNGERVGIKALKKVAGLEGRPINSGTVAFCLAPRINAAGRIGDAGIVVRLLLTQSEAEAIEIAEVLERLNRERQEIEDAILREALEKLGADNLDEVVNIRSYRMTSQILTLKSQIANNIVLASSNWHSGVLGIVASRLVEFFYRPTFLFSIKDGIAKGSARSIPNFHLYDSITECSDLLKSFGGHSYAAGLSMKEENLEPFRIKIDEVLRRRLGDDDLIPKLRIDAKVDFRNLNFSLIKDLAAFSPFGLGNPEPVLGAKKIEVQYPKIVGNNHLKLRLKQNKIVLDGIGFNMGNLLKNQDAPKLGDGGLIDIAFTPSINEWDGSKNLQLEIKAIRQHKQNCED